jgi:lipopolysaccharide transport system ATP-binding protein
MSETAIKVENLGKKYTIGHQVERGRYSTLRDVVMQNVGGVWAKTRDLLQGKAIIQGDTLEEVWALREIDFEIQRGEAVGIIGRNGAGKSTLLKVLSRITEPSTGRVTIRGRVASLLEVGTGFHPELSGRENVYLNGAILGMTRQEIRRKFDEIVAFAEVEKFLDTPVKRYSSGMYVRLAFAVAAHLEPEILIVDEVLAVGDAAFQKKCLGKMGDVAGEGRTILFVSHNMGAINALCSRAILLDKGMMVQDGTPAQTTQFYMSNNSETRTASIRFEKDKAKHFQILYAEVNEVQDENGQDTALLRVDYVVNGTSDVSNTMICVQVRDPMDMTIFYSNDDMLRHPQKRQPGIHSVELKIPSYLLVPGDYSIDLGLWEPGRIAEDAPPERLWFTRQAAANRLATHNVKWPGVIYLPTTWSYKGQHNELHTHKAPQNLDTPVSEAR